MSEHEVPLEEVNEHIQHHAHESKEKWVSGVALTTAFLAAFAAASALLSSSYESRAMKESNKEFDHWNFYQAKGVDQKLLQSESRIIKAIGKEPDESIKKKIEEYNVQRENIKKEAEELHELSEHHEDCQSRFALAVTLFQMSIAIGAISVLTKRKGFWFASLGLGAIGIYFLAMGYSSLPKVETAEKPAEQTEKAEEKK